MVVFEECEWVKGEGFFRARAFGVSTSRRQDHQHDNHMTTTLEPQASSRPVTCQFRPKNIDQAISFPLQHVDYGIGPYADPISRSIIRQ